VAAGFRRWQAREPGCREYRSKDNVVVITPTEAPRIAGIANDDGRPTLNRDLLSLSATTKPTHSPLGEKKAARTSSVPGSGLD